MRCRPAGLAARRRGDGGVAAPAQLLHNCSGKHAGMLLACVRAGWDDGDLSARSHPLQRRVTRAVQRATGSDDLEIGVDGCGVPVHGMPLRSMATLFARLAATRAARGPLAPAADRVIEAMLAEPYLVGGRNRVDTDVMRAHRDVVAKEGAEALDCAAVLSSGLGVAVKIADGGYRAAGPGADPRCSSRSVRSARAPAAGWRTRPPAGARRRAPGGTLEPVFDPAPLGLRSRAFPRRLVASMRKAGRAPRVKACGRVPIMSDAPRVAVLSVHTSPMDQPGTGDSGGMNVYIRAVAERLAEQGRRGRPLHAMPRRRRAGDRRARDRRAASIPIKAGPCAPVPKADLPRFLPEFLGGVLRGRADDGPRLRHRAQPLLAVGLGRADRRRTSGARRSSPRSTRSARSRTTRSREASAPEPPVAAGRARSA